MKARLEPLLALAALTALALALPLAAQAPPQLTIELTPATFEGVPGLHSFAWAQGTGGQWLIVAGRTNGLHTFSQSQNGTPPANAFPSSFANTKIWVIDPVGQKVWSAPLPTTPAIYNSLSATNVEFLQTGQSAQNAGTLYVVGGYGSSAPPDGAMITFGTVTAIPVDSTIVAVMSGNPLPPFQQVTTWYDCVGVGQNTFNTCFNQASAACNPQTNACLEAAQTQCLAQQTSAVTACSTAILDGDFSGLRPATTGPSYVAVTGGGMRQVGEIPWLIFGQNFNGLYSVNPGDYGRYPVNQTYTQRMTALWFGTVNGNLTGAVLNVLQNDPNTTQWNRRDLNVVPMIASDGSSQQVGIYGGVFVPGQTAAFQQPIYLSGGSDPSTATTSLDPYKQLFNQYDAADLNLFDSQTNTMMTAFFGGIGLYYFNTNTNTLQYSSDLPFVNTLSLMTRTANSTSEFYRTTPLPGLIGTDAEFIPNPSAPRKNGEIIAFDQLTGKTLVGWMYGGILATQPQSSNGPTSASNAIYAVYVTPGNPGSGYWGSATSAETSVIKAH